MTCPDLARRMAECCRQRRRRGRRKPTSELDLDLLILRRRPDVGAVVHAHPSAATTFAVVGEGFTPMCCWSLSSLHAARSLRERDV